MMCFLGMTFWDALRDHAFLQYALLAGLLVSIPCGVVGSFVVIRRISYIAGGIAQALITTASGLGIAIFTLFPYNYFNSRVEEATQAIEKYATSLEIVYEKASNHTNTGGGRHED